MTTMANSETMQAMRIRAEDVLERKGATAPRQAGVLAGQFAAMLETLNGSGAVSSEGLDATAVTPAAQPAVRLGVGAVSLFAQEVGTSGDSAQTPDLSPQDPGAALQAVESAMQAGDGSNFRWLTTLLTQSTAA
ncbi:hypothetical protein ACIU1J_25485 [Azospirillum doebereinerae]|uniref:hypothetical protein n=1 Tax=Azospirillum doebereinerae TaxID=92933 RepID=UPI001EE5898B|nr:hypothetical protein [Azospirillum doebereinerae]MCG5244236.1 hypothetical protein [Azospirillum doebereinerae]